MILKSERSRAAVSTIALSVLTWASTAPLVTAEVATVVAPATALDVATTPPAVMKATPTPAPAPVFLRIPEGTEVHVHLNEALSTATASAGDTFTIVSDEEVRLADGVVIAEGYTGKGEVTQADKSGMLGKPGQLSIKLNYLKIGGTHVLLRATKTSEGKSNVTTMVVTTILLSPLALFIHGHSIVLPRGQPMVAYVDEDSTVGLPVAPPPQPS